MGVHPMKKYSVLVAFILMAVVLFLGLYFGIGDSGKVTEYKPSTSTQTESTKDDEDDCSIVMCSAFGGGIVGDTLALDFMSGD